MEPCSAQAGPRLPLNRLQDIPAGQAAGPSLLGIRRTKLHGGYQPAGCLGTKTQPLWHTALMEPELRELTPGPHSHPAVTAYSADISGEDSVQGPGFLIHFASLLQPPLPRRDELGSMQRSRVVCEALGRRGRAAWPVKPAGRDSYRVQHPSVETSGQSASAVISGGQTSEEEWRNSKTFSL